MEPSHFGFGEFAGGVCDVYNVIDVLEKERKFGVMMPFGEAAYNLFMNRIRNHFRPKKITQVTVCLGEDGLIHATGSKARHVCRRMGLGTFVHLEVNE